METISCPICGSDKSQSFRTVENRFSSERELFKIVKCECRFVYLNPRPNFTEISAYYKHAEYDPHREESKTMFNKVYDCVQRWAVGWKRNKIENFVSNGSMLDIGGGKGEFATHMSQNGWSCTLQDTSKEALSIAQRSNISCVNSLDDLEENQQYDLITMWHVLEHVHDIKSLFDKIRKHLSEDGILVVAVPNIDAPERGDFGGSWAPYDAPRHLYHFSYERLEHLLMCEGFTVKRAHPLLQDTPYNILLSLKSFSIVELLMAFVTSIKSVITTLLFGVSRSSSMMLICERKPQTSK
jgi:2-polyprenyl-3-methyl-5-hydroxy-6-metoxy-1,4-benzoquinol methylase